MISGAGTVPADRRPVDSAYDNYRQLEALAHLRAKSPFVPGEGPLNAPLMLIGEAPGEDETRTLRPFTGPSGRMLDDILVGAGIDRRMCYVTNAVKYRPTGSDGRNRAPFYSEISASLPCLLTEVAVVRPVLVGLLGATALKAVNPRWRLGEVHGRPQLIRLGSRPYRVLPLYHPSACLRDPSAEDQVRAALQRVGERHERGQHEATGAG
jgi:DNA polymerase